ncbi:DUF572-domain-containing protein [Annulohypoxylon maeteangense]|uniref:DUF572-domain-containing protein n=1 Tax=Annulohypoxylon maeteangense TaxID=1927788 RepID=UPI0020082867|nr:DUF572-domain-containing protein [Annulohypoxylon maeteangense]KAI0885190.1 DUF572-domain-containing protein [Annulohypoxylon maeteangense]
MSERKVLSKYYPPDFDPSQIKRVKGPKTAGPKVQTVRLAAPFSMKCTTCGEYIYKGRKFNARKETPVDEKYLGIQIFRFYIRCTRCSGQITFKTDPKNQDYACESGAKRSTEPWRVGRDETDEERLDRLEKEEEERNAMVELEAKTVDAKREMAVADALDEIRTRNARLERANHDGVEVSVAMPADDEAERQEREDAEAARKAFEFARQVESLTEDVIDEEMEDTGAASSSSSAGTPASGTPKPELVKPAPAAASATAADMPPPSFKRVVKRKKDHSALLGIKKKPSLV